VTGVEERGVLVPPKEESVRATKTTEGNQPCTSPNDTSRVHYVVVFIGVI
jgi:hypothetical protein